MIPHKVPPVVRLGTARLTEGLDHCRRLDLPAHRTIHGTPAPRDLDTLIAQVDEIDMRGRGGAGFPFARKLRAVAENRGERVVLINATEGEPASHKDAMLLTRAPHLVLDGALLAADALHAREVVLATAEDSVPYASAEAAIAERRAAGVSGADEARIQIRLVGVPERFISGEGGALVRGVNGEIHIPPGRKRRAANQGVDGLPTLLSNAETFAQLALLARHGPEGYATVGTTHEPGTMLLTVGGATVVEAAYGTPLASVLAACSTDPGEGVLIGGYHGNWISPADAATVQLTRSSMKAVGASLGAGIIVPVTAETCPLGEAARITAYLAGESAGQCGPCRFGLPDLARTMNALCSGEGSTEFVRRAVRGVVKRGACSHPDGTSRFVISALDVFSDDVAAHLEFGGCGRPILGLLPLLDDLPGEPEYRLDVDWSRCEGHGLCAHLLPEFITLDEFGFPAFRKVPSGMLREARRAIEMCPALALRLA